MSDEHVDSLLQRILFDSFPPEAGDWEPKSIRLGDPGRLQDYARHLRKYDGWRIYYAIRALAEGRKKEDLS